MLLKIKFSAIILLAVLLSSCNTANIGMIGTRNIDYSATYEKGEYVEYQATSAFIGMYYPIIPISLDDDYPMEVFDQALKKGGYDFMTNVTVERTGFYYFFYMGNKYIIKGTGWRRKIDK